MKKICIIIPKGLPVPDVLGGAIETLITNIINVNENEKKLDITVFCMYNEKAEKIAQDYKSTKIIYIKEDIKYKIKAITTRLKNIFLRKNLFTYNEVILDKIKNQKFDTILVQGSPIDGFKSYLKYFSKSKMMLHIHHNEKATKIANETFGRVIFVSDFVRKEYSKELNITNTVVVKNGIELEKFTKNIKADEKDELRDKLALKKADFVVIYCGRLIKEKGVLELCRAINKIKDETIKLVIVGAINFNDNSTNEYLKMIKEEIDKSNNRILHTGYVNNNQLYKYYKSSDIAIVPSRWEEAAGIVIIEQLVCGLPIITTGTGGIKEYAQDNAIYVENDDKIVESLLNKIEEAKVNREKNEVNKNKRIEHGKKFNNRTMYTEFTQIFLGEENESK